jgi:hypothetical protein
VLSFAANANVVIYLWSVLTDKNGHWQRRATRSGRPSRHGPFPAQMLCASHSP